MHPQMQEELYVYVVVMCSCAGLTTRSRTLVQKRKAKKEAMVSLARATGVVDRNCPAILAPLEASRSRRSGPLQLAAYATSAEPQTGCPTSLLSQAGPSLPKKGRLRRSLGFRCKHWGLKPSTATVASSMWRLFHGLSAERLGPVPTRQLERAGGLELRFVCLRRLIHLLRWHKHDVR